MTMIGNYGLDPSRAYQNMKPGETLSVGKADIENAERVKQMLAMQGSDVELSAKASTRALETRAQARDAVTQQYNAMVNDVIAQQAASAPSSETEEAASVNSRQELGSIKLFDQADVENYHEQLLEKLSSLGVDTSQPIDFGFDYEGKVVVKNDHPDKATIEAAFSEDMELRNGMVQTSTFYLFQELFALNEQWAEKLEAGISEEIAGQWLVNAAKSATNKSSQGLRFEGGATQDPFASSPSRGLASKAYQ